jgi:hypothetical protein
MVVGVEAAVGMPDIGNAYLGESAPISIEDAV